MTYKDTLSGNGKARDLPPLFGLPVSLKDSYQVRGYDTSAGLGCYVGEPAEENSALANMLLDMGAVLYCKSSEHPPTFLLSMRTSWWQVAYLTSLGDRYHDSCFLNYIPMCSTI